MDKPKVLVSACLLGYPYRYNGEILSFERIKVLSQILHLVPVCPEVEIGLGVPRFPIKLVNQKGMIEMIQAGTNYNVTYKVKRYTNSKLRNEFPFFGLIVKSKSPSCSPGDAKIYLSANSGKVVGYGKGTFTGKIIARFPYLPVISEKSDECMIDEFLIKVFLLYTLYRYGIKELKVVYFPLLKALLPAIKVNADKRQIYTALRQKLKPFNYIRILKVLFGIKPERGLSLSYMRGDIGRREFAEEVIKNTYKGDIKLLRYLMPYPLYNT